MNAINSNVHQRETLHVSWILSMITGMCNVDVLLVAASLVSIVCTGNHLHRIRTEKGSKEGGRERES